MPKGNDLVWIHALSLSEPLPCAGGLVSVLLYACVEACPLASAIDLPRISSIDSGHSGLQATVHIRGKTECFECQPKQAPKTYPVCTIRNAPDKPIHCIVWAKDLLFQRLFGRWVHEMLALDDFDDCQ